MTYTTNYNLHKPDTTDNFNIGDFNANSDIIDKQFGITSANVPRVTCDTSGSTVAKTATIDGKFVLNRGARLIVVLSNENTVASATFNLNSTGAKPILINGASVTESNLGNKTYLAEYDGSSWRFTTNIYTSDYARYSNGANSAVSANKLTTARTTYVTLGTASTSTTRDWSGDTTIPVDGTLGVANGGTGQTNLANVNVGSATKLATARSLKVALGSTTSVTFDGSANQNSIPISGTLKVANGGTGATTALGAEYNLIGSVENVETDLSDSRYFALKNETVSATDGTFKWNKVSKIKKYTESNYWYGTCSTASATVAKTVTLSGFELVANVRVTIKFTNANTATNATLNINSTGAKPIYYHGANVSSNLIVANSTLNLVYNGTQYEIVGDFTSSSSSDSVTGVKGEAETNYRQGNVNISKSDLGLTTDEMGMVWHDSNVTGYGDDDFYPYYANGIWVIGFNHGIKYSTDGKTWNDSNINDSCYNPYYSNGVWVIAGPGDIRYSTDGKFWNDSNITNEGYFYFYPYCANGIWVIGSNRGILYSTDGKTWNNSNITNGNYDAPYYANGIWVIGSNTGGGIKYSADGKTWSNSNITNASGYNPYYANGIWVIGCGRDSDYPNGQGILYSTDGKTWSNSNITSGCYYYPYYANGIWVIGASNLDTGGIKYSIDGKTWNDSNITDGIYRNPYYANGIWVIGTDSSGIKYSIDGKTWNDSNITNSSSYLYYCVPYYANGVWVIGNGDGVLYSTFNSLNDLGSAFKGISELKTYVDNAFTTKSQSYVVSHKLYL